MNTESREFSYGRPPRPTVAPPATWLQWATGLDVDRSRQLYAGWFSETGKDSDLDDAMRDAGIPQVTIRHRGTGPRTHWALEEAKIVPLVLYLPDWADLAEDRKSGIAFAWGQRGGRPRSHMRIQVLLAALLPYDYARPLVLTVGGKLTQFLYDALLRQYDVLDAAEQAARARGKALEYPFYAFSLPLGPGEPVQVGATERKTITPMVARLPATIDEPYLRAASTRTWRDTVEDRLADAIPWSAAESRRLAAQPAAE